MLGSGALKRAADCPYCNKQKIQSRLNLDHNAGWGATCRQRRSEPEVISVVMTDTPSTVLAEIQHTGNIQKY